MRFTFQGIRDLLSNFFLAKQDVKRIVVEHISAAHTAKVPVLCNLGCGIRHHSAWINIDFSGDGKSVLPWDLRQGLPLPNESCDAIYSSHLIEHFSRHEASCFLEGCRRVLKPGGIIRLATPDLEDIARTYLSCLDAARHGLPQANEHYEWIIIELLDQLVRHQSGGEMLRFWSKDVVPAENFVEARVGVEFRRARSRLKGHCADSQPYSAAAIGRFRLGGEVHQWMYDSYSLGKLLADLGFVDILLFDALTSGIPSFSDYNLDTEPDGSVYKPDSFFIEAKSS